MKAKGKTSGTPHPIWVEGEYIKVPPMRPCDGAMRPIGHYIDKGGYPGANVYEISAETLCRATGTADRTDKTVYENDILLYETPEEIAYFIVADQGRIVDMVHGECLELKDLQSEDIKVIGNVVDSEDFIEGIRYYAENDIPIPYVPCINVQLSSLPYMILECGKCGHRTLSCRYMARCPSCGEFVAVGYATKVYREKEKASA